MPEPMGNPEGSTATSTEYISSIPRQHYAIILLKTNPRKEVDLVTHFVDPGLCSSSMYRVVFMRSPKESP